MDSNVMKKLVDELNEASKLYYNGGESPLTDAEFDKKLDKLKELEQKMKIIYSNSPTINVGAPILSELKKIKISGKPMLSLDKVHSAQEIIDFDSSDDLIASIKCDGLSVRLIYKDTDLVSANTRGNGYEGADITEHVKHFLNVPLKIAKTGTYIIDGEAIIYDKDFAIVNKNGEFKNNRNTASGALSLLDTSIVEERRLSFIAWDVIEGGSTWYYHYNMEEADSLGFTTVPALALDCTKIEAEEINKINKTLLTEAEEKGIPCDGVVWRINDLFVGDEKGSTAHHFLNAVAFKPSDEEVETELLDIELSLGRTGILTPVAIFKPVWLQGSEIERASLHNVSVMREILGDSPSRGQKIWVCKCNQIIPQVTRSEIFRVINNEDLIFSKDEFQVCPACGKPLTISESESGVLNFVCENPQCSGKIINILDHFCGDKGIKINGLSKKTLEKLLDWGYITRLSDIFRLGRYRTEWISKDGFGPASVDRILTRIDETRKHVKLESFISGLAIPLVGTRVSEQITELYPTWEEFRKAVCGKWSDIDGFGYEMEKAINNFDYSEADEIVDAGYVTFIQEEPQIEVSQTAAIKGKTFVITGKLSRKRDEIKKEIESLGGRVTGSVSSKTDYLICNDKNSTTGKSADARKLGVKIITEDEYLKLKS